MAATSNLLGLLHHINCQWRRSCQRPCDALLVKIAAHLDIKRLLVEHTVARLVFLVKHPVRIVHSHYLVNFVLPMQQYKAQLSVNISKSMCCDLRIHVIWNHFDDCQGSAFDWICLQSWEGSQELVGTW